MPCCSGECGARQTSGRTVYRFIATGDLPVVDLRTGLGRSRVRVPAADLDEFTSRRVVEPLAARR